MAALAALGHAAAAATFTDVTASVGITHVQSAASGAQAMTGGAAAGDFDGDGLVDLFFTRVDDTDVLYRNTGAGFVDVSTAAGFTETLPTNGVAAGDIDNDGDLDLYVTGSEAYRYFLYINDGAGHFTEEALTRGASVAATGVVHAQGTRRRPGRLRSRRLSRHSHVRPQPADGRQRLAAAAKSWRRQSGIFRGRDAQRRTGRVSSAALRRDGRRIAFSRSSATSIATAIPTSCFRPMTARASSSGTTATARSPTARRPRASAPINRAWARRSATTTATATSIGSSRPFSTRPSSLTQPGNRLYRNNGNRTFTDVTTAAGVRDSGWRSWGYGVFRLRQRRPTGSDDHQWIAPRWAIPTTDTSCGATTATARSPTFPSLGASPTQATAAGC